MAENNVSLVINEKDENKNIDDEFKKENFPIKKQEDSSKKKKQKRQKNMQVFGDESKKKKVLFGNIYKLSSP